MIAGANNMAASDLAAAYEAFAGAVAALRRARPGMSRPTALVLLANAAARTMGESARRYASDFFRATGDAMAPDAPGRELAQARRVKAASAFIAAAAGVGGS